jgi:uncharacterized membrane protein YdjX (TVP38/TMEM64 family)
MRTWAQSVGIAAPLLFLLGHTLVTMAPVPRTVFTLAAGLLLRTGAGLPFSVLNHCSALSSIGFASTLAGTVGVVPGSVAVVVLGDALTGTTSPALLAVSLTGAAIGVVGLIVEAHSPTAATQGEGTSS